MVAPGLVTDAAFGLIGRAAPQMNVYFVALPAKILAVFVAVAASLPLVTGHVDDVLQQALVHALRAAGD